MYYFDISASCMLAVIKGTPHQLYKKKIILLGVWTSYPKRLHIKMSNV